MGTIGTLSTEKSKLTINRKKFLEWAIVDNPSLFTPLATIKADLINCGEFILEAQTILDTYNEIPAFLIMETVDEVFIDPADCVMSLINDESS